MSTNGLSKLFNVFNRTYYLASGSGPRNLLLNAGSQGSDKSDKYDKYNQSFDSIDLSKLQQEVVVEQPKKSIAVQVFQYLSRSGKSKKHHMKKFHHHQVHHFSTKSDKPSKVDIPLDDNGNSNGGGPKKSDEPRFSFVHDEEGRPRLQFQKDVSPLERREITRQLMALGLAKLGERSRTDSQFKYLTPCQDILDTMHQVYESTMPVSELPVEEINRLVDRYYDAGAAKKDKMFWIVIGSPGAGKSSRAVDPLTEYFGALMVDSDKIKQWIPGYQKGYGSNAVHGDSRKIAGMVLEKGMKNGDNLVFPTTGGNLKSMQTLAQAAKDHGYKVGLCLVNIDPKEAVDRVLSRTCQKDSDGNTQIVTTDYVNELGTQPYEVYQTLTSGGYDDLIDAHFAIDTTGLKKGEPAPLLDSSDNVKDMLQKQFKVKQK